MPFFFESTSLWYPVFLGTHKFNIIFLFMNISRKSCTENHDTWQGRDGHPSVFLLGGSSYLFVFYLVRVRDGHHFSHCNGFWEGVAKLFVFLFGGRGHLPTFYLGRDGHSLILPFGGAGNLTPFNLGGDGHLFM